jgi:type IV pilus assembly protein PilY1
LWGFIPYELLPQLQWLTRTDYLHVYYVDLKPKVTDARIFTPDADHPNGWGTILIGGFRMGGSCKVCTAGTGAPEMKVNIGGTDRYFYSAYFVLDVTNPEADPKLLWSFSYEELGLTTSYPVVVRVNPTADSKTDNTNAKWFLVAGSGPTGYSGASSQESKFYAVDLKTGPKDGAGSKLFTEFKRGDGKAFMGDLISLDANLDYRADVVYGGSVIDQGTTPPWEGKLLRLTIGTTAPFGGATTPSLWGVSQKPTDLLDSFSCTPSPCNGPTIVGPVTAAPTVTADDASKIWVFFGTGRYYTSSDKIIADTQHFFGVKDPVLTGACTQTSETNCRRNDLVNVSAATVCVVGTGDCGQSGGTNQVTGVSGVSGDLNFSGSSTSTLEGLVQSKDGWFTTLPEARERSVVAPTLIGGIVFFPTFAPVGDICGASGSGFLYALFYKTGSAYKESVIGTETSGSNSNISRRIALSSAGLASQMAIHIGGQGSGDSGASGTGTGCAGQVTGFLQSSTGTLSQLCTKPPGQVWSRYISWINQRM